MNMKAATIPQPLARPRHLVAAESRPSFRAIARPLIDTVVPVLNEEKILQKVSRQLINIWQLKIAKPYFGKISL